MPARNNHRPHVVVVGGASVDTLLKSSVAPAKDMQFTSTPARMMQRSVGGVGWNIARNLTRRFDDVDVTFCTVVGDDPSGAFVKEQLAKEVERSRDGVGDGPRLHVHVERVEGHPTASYIAMLGSDGELAAAAAVMEIFDRALRPSVMMIDRDRRPRTDVLVLDGNVANTTAALIADPPNGCRVIAIDPISKAKAKRLVPVLKTAEAAAPVVMKPNVFEAEALAVDLGIAVPANVDDSTDAVAAMCARIIEACPALHALLCTRGPKGVVIACRVASGAAAIVPEGWSREPMSSSVITTALPAAPLLRGQKVVKVTGAGDAFFSTVIATLARSPNIRPATLAEASRAGCIVSRDVITTPPSKL